MNTCISRETLQLVGPSCAELGAGWSLLALDQLNSNVKKEVKSLAGYLDLSCPYYKAETRVTVPSNFVRVLRLRMYSITTMPKIA